MTNEESKTKTLSKAEIIRLKIKRDKKIKSKKIVTK